MIFTEGTRLLCLSVQLEKALAHIQVLTLRMGIEVFLVGLVLVGLVFVGLVLDGLVMVGLVLIGLVLDGLGRSGGLIIYLCD